MGHYDDCRPGYCPKCGGAPGNIVGGVCEFCKTAPNPYPRTNTATPTPRRATQSMWPDTGKRTLAASSKPQWIGRQRAK